MQSGSWLSVGRPYSYTPLCALLTDYCGGPQTQTAVGETIFFLTIEDVINKVVFDCGWPCTGAKWHQSAKVNSCKAVCWLYNTFNNRKENALT